MRHPHPGKLSRLGVDLGKGGISGVISPSPQRGSQCGVLGETVPPAPPQQLAQWAPGPCKCRQQTWPCSRLRVGAVSATPAHPARPGCSKAKGREGVFPPPSSIFPTLPSVLDPATLGRRCHAAGHVADTCPTGCAGRSISWLQIGRLRQAPGPAILRLAWSLGKERRGHAQNLLQDPEGTAP